MPQSFSCHISQLGLQLLHKSPHQWIYHCLPAVCFSHLPQHHRHIFHIALNLKLMLYEKKCCLCLFNLIFQKKVGHQMGVSQNNGTPKSFHFNRVFHCRPSILGYPHFWKHPNSLQQQKNIRVKHLGFIFFISCRLVKLAKISAWIWNMKFRYVWYDRFKTHVELVKISLKSLKQLEDHFFPVPVASSIPPSLHPRSNKHCLASSSIFMFAMKSGESNVSGK